jgi:hypothetical protein
MPTYATPLPPLLASQPQSDDTAPFPVLYSRIRNVLCHPTAAALHQIHPNPLRHPIARTSHIHTHRRTLVSCSLSQHVTGGTGVTRPALAPAVVASAVFAARATAALPWGNTAAADRASCTLWFTTTRS